MFQRLVDEWESWTLEIEDLIDGGEKVVSLGRYNARNKAAVHGR